MSDEGQTDLAGMGMGVLRWLLGSRRSREDDEGEQEKAEEWKRGKRARGRSPGYRIEVDGESRAMRGEGPPFSFWGSARIILILSFLLWWIQPAGPMIAGYVGGRRSGSPIKGVLAALLPVLVILVANVAYARDLGTRQIDFVGSLPDAVAGGTVSLLPFLLPYKVFLVGYMSGFVSALQNTFGMGTNGYLMVIIFAYIGGVIAEQTRRELYYKNGANQTVGLNLIQPFFGGRHPAEYDSSVEDEELREFRRPVRAHTRGHREPFVETRGPRRRRHGRPDRFEDFRKVNGDPYEAPRRSVHARARDEEDEPSDVDEEEAASVRGHRAAHGLARDHRARAAEEEDEENEEAVARREAHEARHPRQRSHEEEVAIQRFVERALRQYEHPTH